MALPNFLCVGAQKAGTTTLYEILKQHPGIFLPDKVKETKFFVYEEKFEKGVQWYGKEFFSERKNQTAAGEVDPAMMFEEKSAQRIYDALGKEVKLIFIFRNPVSRAYSHYLMSQRKGFEDLSFDEAIGKEAERLKSDPEKKFNYSYFARGYYSKQVDRFLKLFPEKNFLFLVFEDDFIKNRKATFDRIQDFLGVKKIDLNLDIRSNEAAATKSKLIHDLTRKKNPLKKIFGALVPKGLRKSLQRFISSKNTADIQNPRLDPKREKELIRQYFIEDIHKLEKMIHRDLSSWYN
jgi:hypothetical protein